VTRRGATECGPFLDWGEVARREQIASRFGASSSARERFGPSNEDPVTFGGGVRGECQRFAVEFCGAIEREMPAREIRCARGVERGAASVASLSPLDVDRVLGDADGTLECLGENGMSRAPFVARHPVPDRFADAVVIEGDATGVR
jgi:hypothetical protein